LLGFEGYTAEGGELSPLIQYNEQRDDFFCFAFISKRGKKKKRKKIFWVSLNLFTNSAKCLGLLSS